MDHYCPCRDSLTGSIAHMEQRVREVDNSQKLLMQMINNLPKDFRATFDIDRARITNVSVKVNFTME